MEGGALNANYTLVDAVAVICTKCGEMGLKYGEDFYWEGASMDGVRFSFKNPKYIMALGLSV